MKAPLFLLLILVLGCSGQELRPGSELPAIVIKDYSFDQDTIKQGQKTGVNLLIKNFGDEKARDIRTKIFRTEEGVDVLSANPQPAAPLTLNPHDESTKTEGESREFIWEIQAKTPADRKTTKAYNIGVIVGYDYKSEGFSDLLATTKEQAKIDKNNLPALRSGSTQGPISVNVITPNSIIYGTDEIVTVRVDVVNGANGVVYAGRSEPGGVTGNSNEMNRIKKLEIRIPKQYTKINDPKVGSVQGGLWCCKPDCTDPQEQLDYGWILDEASDPDYRILRKDFGAFTPAQQDTLTLLRGRQRSYVCYFLVDKATIPEQQIIPVRATAEYAYSTEASRILVVEGS